MRAVERQPLDDELSAAVASVPPGAWAVGVSGGADSVALLLLLRRHRAELSLEVVHLNHETRSGDSDADADFVFHLATTTLGVDAVVGRRGAVEQMVSHPPTNPSARYRAARIALFRHVVTSDKLNGVILAHHADDVAETVLQRLLRGSGGAGLAGIRPTSAVGGLVVLRPLLNVRRAALRQFLREQGQPWREDASNTSPHYQRNRLRGLLQRRTELTQPLLNLAHACAAVKAWTRRHAPQVGKQLEVATLRDLPPPLAAEVARRWLVASGVPPHALDAPVLSRLLEMATDAAAPARRHFPGGVLVRRRGRVLFVDAESEAGGLRKR
jgi:tRNA(Ile)-lysidine synthase